MVKNKIYMFRHVCVYVKDIIILITGLLPLLSCGTGLPVRERIQDLQYDILDLKIYISPDYVKIIPWT